MNTSIKPLNSLHFRTTHLPVNMGTVYCLSQEIPKCIFFFPAFSVTINHSLKSDKCKNEPGTKKWQLQVKSVGVSHFHMLIGYSQPVTG